MHPTRIAVRRFVAVFVGLTPPAWLLWAAAAWSRDAPLTVAAQLLALGTTTLLALAVGLALLLEERIEG